MFLVSIDSQLGSHCGPKISSGLKIERDCNQGLTNGVLKLTKLRNDRISVMCFTLNDPGEECQLFFN